MKKLIFKIFITLTFIGSPKIYSSYFMPEYNSLNTYFIQDLISLNNFSNEEIHDYLILKDWLYIQTERTREGGSFFPSEKQTITFNHSQYPIKTLIINSTYFTDSKRQKIEKTERHIRIITEKPDEYKLILTDLYKNNFKISGKETQLFILDIAANSAEETINNMKQKFVNTQKSMKNYSNGKYKLQILTEVFEKFDKKLNTLRYNRYTLSIVN